uniref:hypothetical protein n=1 Tax=Vibrio cholerae TaxID=666 RepID=UPI001B3BCA51
PQPWQGCALPTELVSHFIVQYDDNYQSGAIHEVPFFKTKGVTSTLARFAHQLSKSGALHRSVR